MNRLPTKLAIATLLLAGASLAEAASISFQSTLSLMPTDLTNEAVAITPFIPGTFTIPVNAILDSYTITYTQGITGSLTLHNKLLTGSTETYRGVMDTYGYVYLFSPGAVIDHLTFDPFTPGGYPDDDIFGGTLDANHFQSGNKVLAPDASTNVTYGSPTPISVSKSTGTVTTGLGSVQSAYNAYVSTVSIGTVTYVSGSNGEITLSQDVVGTFDVVYNYHLNTVPEPGAMFLAGGALLSVAVLRKRHLNRQN